MTMMMPMPEPVRNPFPIRPTEYRAPQAAPGSGVPLEPVSYGGGGGLGREQRTLTTLMNDVLGGEPLPSLASTGPATTAFAEAVGKGTDPNVLLAGMFWWAVLNGPAAERELRLAARDRAERLLVSHADGTRFSLLALSSDDGVRTPAELHFSVTADEIMDALTSGGRTVIDLLADRFESVAPVQAFDAIEEIAYSGPNFGAVLAPMPETEYTCVPEDAVPVRISHAGKQRSAVGLLFRNGHNTFATTALHAVQGFNGNVIVGDAHGTVVAEGSVTDSCLIRLSALPPSAIAQEFGGFYDGFIPGQWEQVRFHRVGEGSIRTRVFTTDMDAFDPDPTGRIRSYTDPVTIPSDSGAALLDNKDQVIGFAYRRTKRKVYLQFSSWIWAQQAVTELGIADQLKEGCHGLVG